MLVFIILQNITITAERGLIKSYKNTVEEFNQTIKSLQDEKHQLQNNFYSLNQKKLELETRVKVVTAEKDQLQRSTEFFIQRKLELEKKVKDLNAEKDVLQRSFDSLNKKKLELESKVTSLSEELKKESTKRGWFFLSSELKSWSDSRQYCRDRGADLVIINSEEKQHITITAERDLIKSYKNTVEEFNETINSLQSNYTDLMIEKHHLQNNFSSLSQKKLELETRVTSLSDELKKNVSNGGNQSSLDGLFISKKPMSWSDSRQYCRDCGADLVIINSEEKQRLISSSFRERLWIGLSDRENEGNLTWVDNSPLKQRYVLSAPNILKVGAPEKVFVEAQDYFGASLNVKISVRNPKDNNREVTSASVSLTPDKNYQDLVEIEVPGNAFSFEKGVEQYAILQARFPQKLLEKKVMVIFQSGHIVLQTDKTIYTPDSTVYYRVFSLSSGMTRPVESGVRVEILTPDGISLESKSVYPGGGMVSGTFSLTDPASPGLWKLVAWHKNSPQKNFSSEFEVKEYVLPSFEVSLSPQKAFFYVNDDSLTVDIDAKYLFGETVSGHGFVVFGVVTEDKGKISIPGSLQRVQILDGSGTAELRRKHILQTFPNIMQLVGHSLYVTVSVLTESGSEMVEAHKKGIQIVTSPYTIHFRRTPHYFKPGMPFDISVYVTNPDQTPAKNVEVEVNPGGTRGQTRDNGIAKVTVNTPGRSSTLEITAKTRDPRLSNDQQAVKKMTAQAYKPKGGSNNYLHIGIGAAELQIGDQMKVSLNLGRSPGVRDQDFTYMILSKGQIVQADRFKRRGQSLVSLSLTVTKDMVPSFRFVAYYHVGSSEVVSDSVWVDVKDTCMGTLKVEVHNPVNVYEPGEDFDLRITGDPGAKVGLVAVDKGVYVLNNKNRITQTKIWGVVESHDIGCTAGSGKDSMEVFSDAGLLFESSSAGGTGVRTISKFSGIGRECCMDGLKKLDDYSCQYRASFIVEGKECIQAFLHCCAEITAHFEDSAEEMILSRSECEDFVNSDDIVTRTLFPESWLWEEVVLPKCSALNRQCQTTTFPRDGLKLKDSITTWEITAISLSSTHGICVADVHEMTVVKNFFIDLKLPYSAVRNEQIEIKAVIHNLYSRRLKVRVELMETKDICSPASKRGKFQTIVTVDAKSSYSVPFVIVPLALGRHAIEVKAAAAGRASDGVRKELLVVSEGVLTKLNENLQFSPSKKGGEHVEVINSLILKDQAPNTPSITYVSAIGDTISITIEKAISGHAMGSLIIQPGGCGEQNMAGLTMPVIATHYLDKTSQWHTLNAGLRETAVTYITRGYNQQLAYRKTDGSYAAYISRPSSTWLTAYVAKVFAMASNIVYIDRNVICSALNWLIQNKQLPDGVFREDAPVLSGGMTGNVHGENTQASMTAFVLIALQEGRGICAGQISSLDSSMYKAIVYLRSQIHSLTNPYAVAMTSYALASGNALDKQVLLRKAYADGSHWPVPGSSTFTLEASAYALLALVKAQDFQSAAPIVNWLNNQRQYSGGYGSTQIPSNRQITISAKGSGEASVTVVTEYYAKPKESKSTCNNFELALAFERNDKVTYQGATESYKLIIKTRYLSADRDATMSILDISLLTGFVVDENDLKALSTGCDRIIQKFEMNKQLSERGSLILYLDKISHTREERISFRLHRIMNGGFLQPAAVTVYEYYSIVYKAVVLRENEDALTVYYDMKIELALKTGPEKNVEGMQRTFSLQISCKEALNLKGGESYLIMGQADDVQMEGRIGQYALGERTWLEFWPSLEESKTSAELKEKYNGMLSLQQDLRFGCG
ncbi:complement C3-like protein [Labeo rohita]|uniref:Complement C3-like protein n=1 Tax=Labeo rohita TaxID=84645 RepID=A0A498MKU4_LABRO|nr:complement C3-like protein [Labeo rohita]